MQKKKASNTLIRVIGSKVDTHQWYRPRVRTFPKQGA